MLDSTVERRAQGGAKREPTGRGRSGESCVCARGGFFGLLPDGARRGMTEIRARHEWQTVLCTMLVPSLKRFAGGFGFRRQQRKQLLELFGGLLGLGLLAAPKSAESPYLGCPPCRGFGSLPAVALPGKRTGFYWSRRQTHQPHLQRLRLARRDLPLPARRPGAVGVGFYKLLGTFRVDPEAASANWLPGATLGIGGLAGMYVGARVQDYLSER